MDLPESAGADDTTAGQDRGHDGARPWRSPSRRLLQAVAMSKPAYQHKKGDPKAALFRVNLARAYSVLIESEPKL
jgi:hypothetical protein